MGTRRYHATPSDHWRSILSTGLEPSSAHECDCGMGVHLTATPEMAHDWIARLREERDEYYYTEFLIIVVEVPDEVEIVRDEHIGVGLRGEIACTTEPIPPEQIGLYERV